MDRLRWSMIPLVVLWMACAKPSTDEILIMHLESRFTQLQDTTKLQQEAEWAWNDLKSREIPAVYDSHAIFLYRGSGHEVRLTGDITSWQPGPHLIPLGRSDIFALSMIFPDSAHVDYKLIVDGEWELDRANPRQVAGGFGANSELRMPRYQPAPELEMRPEVARGELDSLSFTSDLLRNTRPIRVYLPPGYRQSDRRYPALYFLDGTDYLRLARVNVVADNLIHEGSIEPLVMILAPPITPEARATEYGNNPMFAECLVKELVPLMQSRYRLLDDARQRALCGDSYGGLASFYIGLRSPGVFGNIASQSGHFGFDDGAILKLVQTTNLQGYKFYFHCGTYETGIVAHGTSFVGFNRKMRDALAAKEASFTYREYPSGHSWGYWRDEVGRILRAFFAIQR